MALCPPASHRLPPCRITVDGANLTVSNVTEEDEGVYVCSAQTALDSVTEETRVTVLGECLSGPSPCCPVPR